MDRRVLNLAKELSETRERRMPEVLLKLKDMLDKAPRGTAEGTEMRKEIWEFNILHMLIIIIRQDFSILPGEWRTAAKLSILLSDACCGMELAGAERKELFEEQLPKAIENLFLLAKHIQTQIINMPVNQERAKDRTDLVVHFREVLDSMTLLVNAYYCLCEEVMKCPWLLHLLVSDDAKTVNMVMGLMDRMLRCDGKVLSKVNEQEVLNLMDELVYKLSVGTDVSIAASATRCVLRMCEQHKPLVETLFARYKGLRPLLKRWDGRGFDRDLRQMSAMLESGSALRAQSQRKQEAASYIQALWRGVFTRRRLKRANVVFAKFHRSYRLRKAKEEHALLETRVQTELQRRMDAKRRKMMIYLKEKHLQVMEVLPAAQVEKFLMKEKQSAALRIQTLWRGHKERNQLTRRQEVAQQVKAAIKIQRMVRKWLDRLERQQQKIPTHFKPSGLTDERCVELQDIINRRRQEQPSGRRTREEIEEIHKKAGVMLAWHYRTIRQYRKSTYNWENLLARLDTDSELVELAPPLTNVTEKDAEMYSSRSLAVATKAKLQHNETLRRLQQPWWRQKWEETYEMDEDDREKMEAELDLVM